MKIINGRKIAKTVLEGLKSQVQELDFQPVFCDVLVGDDFASKKYVKMKAKKAEELGLVFQGADFPESISTQDLVEEIQKLNNVKNMCGIIVQLPLPEHIDARSVLDAIDPKLDVDALGSASAEKFYEKGEGFVLPTAKACLHILKEIEKETGGLKEKSIVVLGQGELVGRPVSKLLEIKGYKQTPVDTKTQDQESILRNADVIISGIGVPGFIKGEMLKGGVVLIDAGTSEQNGSLSGDVDMDSVGDLASFVSPVPGGVGPLTIAMLFQNVLEVARTKNQNA